VKAFIKKILESSVHVDFDAAACHNKRKEVKYYNYSHEEIENSVICGDLTKKRN
jgi:hypothetical protein